MRRIVAVATLALFATACAESATAPLAEPGAPSFAVTLNEDGTGFVGKGDVQTVFGWNNSVMQKNHTGVTFDYAAVTTYSWSCEWYTGPTHNVQHHEIAREEIRSVAASVASDSRKTGQWTGWHLQGFGDTVGDGGEVTPSCSGNPAGDGNSGEKTVVEGSFSSSANGGGLYATHNGDRRLIQ